MGDESGLICAYALDGEGGGRALDWDGVRESMSADGVTWVHLGLNEVETSKWFDEIGLDPLIADALLDERTRPRLLSVAGGIVVILRGVNLNPGADPEDMVSIRAWIEPNRIVTVRLRRLAAVTDLREQIERGNGPTSAPDFLVQLAGKMTDRAGPIVAALEDSVDSLEERTIDGYSAELRHELGERRREAIVLRRYLSPQREALSKLAQEPSGWLDEQQRLALREVGNEVQRYVEALDAARDRAAVVHEEVGHLIAEQTNRTIYLLSLVTAVFLPLSFITGLLGINVDGIPGANQPYAFAVVAALLVGLGALQVFTLQRRGLL